VTPPAAKPGPRERGWGVTAGPSVLWVAKTEDTKTGGIPASYTAAETCPPACALSVPRLLPSGRTAPACYAHASWHVKRAWNKASDTANPSGNTLSWGAFCARVAALAAGTLWRHDVAGDLPGVGNLIHAPALRALVAANAGRRGFTYTHKPVLAGRDASGGMVSESLAARNRAAIADANTRGFAVNLSADSLADADAKAALGVGPVAVVLPADAPDRLTTPEGRTVQVCPQVTGRLASCKACGACASTARRAIIGFPVHGTNAAAFQTKGE